MNYGEDLDQCKQFLETSQMFDKNRFIYSAMLLFE